MSSAEKRRFDGSDQIRHHPVDIEVSDAWKDLRLRGPAAGAQGVHDLPAGLGSIFLSVEGKDSRGTRGGHFRDQLDGKPIRNRQRSVDDVRVKRSQGETEDTALTIRST